jgi:lipopolysaccharide export system protein LptC
VVLALALIVLAATIWAAGKNAANDTAAPIPSDAIYRTQHLNLF